MRTINTTAGPVEVAPHGPGAGHVINTSRVTEEDLTYLDEEPEIIAIVPGTGWQAVVEGDELVALVAFVALDDASMYGVAVGPRGRVDLVEDNVETYPGFTGYTQTNHKEEK